MQSSDKKPKIFSISLLRKPFSRNIQDRSAVVQETHSISLSKELHKEETDKSNDAITYRSRTQRFFRSIKKKLEHNKLLVFRTKGTIPRPVITPTQDIISRCERNHKAPEPYFHSLGKEHFNLGQYGWYWGPVNKKDAEEKLRNLPNGSFLVRDSSSDHHFYTLSFRAQNCTFHARINYSCGSYSLHEGAAYPSITALISENRLPCAIPQRLVKRNCIAPTIPRASIVSAYIDIIPVHITLPVSRFNEVRTLQYLCRFVIRQYISVGNIEQLPVPDSVKGYLIAGHY